MCFGLESYYEKINGKTSVWPEKVANKCVYSKLGLYSTQLNVTRRKSELIKTLLYLM